MANRPIDIKRLVFYIWIGVAFLMLSLCSELVSSSSNYVIKIFNEIWLAILVIVVNFTFFEYSVPFIRRRWKKVMVTSWVLVSVVVLFAYLLLYSYGIYYWRSLGIQLRIYTELKQFDTIDDGLGIYFGYGFASVFFFGIVKNFFDYNTLKLSAQRLTIEKQQAELNYLKSQTNPHFLFNTLNNIYSLARDKSDLAPESILRLSKILRYILYEAGGPYIAVEQELKIISDYISLEKLRYDDSLHVNFKYDVEDMRQSLPPLLLIPLIENAFKHGASETRDGPFVDIHLSMNKRRLNLIVRNSTDVFDDELPIVENIGLSNLRRQLELLFKEFSLSFQRKGSAFTATLQVNISSHV